VAVRGVVHGALRQFGDCDGVYYLGRGWSRWWSARAKRASTGSCRWRASCYRRPCGIRHRSWRLCRRSSMRHSAR
jgi:hypothetical protein